MNADSKNSLEAQFYLAYCPDPATREMLAAFGKELDRCLGGSFKSQLSQNLHMTAGHFTARQMAQTPFAKWLPLARITPTRKPLMKKLNSDKDSVTHFELFKRKTTGEIMLGLCFSCNAMEEQRHAMHTTRSKWAPPHVTLGKFLPDEGETPDACMARLTGDLQDRKGVFARLRTAPDIAFSFDSVYIAPSNHQLSCVPSHPQIPDISSSKGK